MARCSNCNFNLDHHNPIACPEGFCDSCNERVCYECGCTQRHPCVLPGGLTCSWQLFLLRAEGWIELGPCDVCFWRAAAESYGASLDPYQVLTV